MRRLPALAWCTLACSHSFLHPTSSLRVYLSRRHVTTASQTPPASSAATSSSPSLQLAAPLSFTHEALSVLACPLCGATQALETLFQHLVTVHRQAYPLATYQSLCRARLALYEEVVGQPLMTAQERQRCGLEADLSTSSSTTASSASCASLSSSSNPAQEDEHAATATNATATSSTAATTPMNSTTGSPPSTSPSGQEAWRTQLPTLTANGYVCNWCVLRATFPTRDALLLHVCRDHPLLDVDLVEPLVPLLPTKRTAQTPSSDWVAQRPAQSSGWGREDTAAAHASHKSSASLRYVLPGAFDRSSPHAVATSGEGTAAPPLFFRPRRGVSVSPSLDALAAAPSLAERPSPSRTLAFGDACFPCELCTRTFTTEPGLLNHLLATHITDGNDNGGGEGESGANTESGSGGGSDDVSIADVMRREARLMRHHGAPSGAAASTHTLVGSVPLRCDLCEKSNKVYMLPSALFAHLRFKHPREDAAFHVDRLLKAAQYAQQQQQREAQRATRGVHSAGETPTTTTATAASPSTTASTTLADAPGPNTTPCSFPCAFCTRVFASAEAREGHMADKHNVAATRRAADAIASAASPSSPASASSLPPATPKTLWWCEVCEKGFSSARSLISHAVGKHQRPLEALPCPACKRVLTDSYALEDHMKAAHPSLPFQELGLRDADAVCGNCHRCFLSQEALRTHIARHHASTATTTTTTTVTPPTSARLARMDPPQASNAPAAAEGGQGVSDATPSRLPSGPRKVSRRRHQTSASGGEDA